MDTRQWTHILKLLGVVVVVDQRVYKEEVDMFVKQAVRLAGVISPEMIFSKKMAFDWFVVHRDEIKALVEDIDQHTTTLRHVLALGESPYRKDILQSIFTIATIDGEYHASEVDVIAMACKHWNLPIPTV